MPWFRVDDTLTSHPKTRAAGLPAMGLWVLCGAYSAQYLTEGFVPDWYVTTWPSGRKHAQQLVEAGLWSVVPGGWQFHQWEERQPTKAQVETLRAKTRERQRKYRKKRDETVSDVSNAVTNGVADDVTNAAPTQPSPTSSIEEVAATESRPDVEAICQLLADCVEHNIDRRPKITKTWRTEARRLLDRDGRTQQQVEHVIRWSTSDTFWKANIQSMPTLRDKFDRLLVQAREDWRRNNSSTAPSPDGDIDPDAILGRDLWQPPTPPPDLEPGTPEYRDWHRAQADQHRDDRIREALVALKRKERGA